MLARPFFALLLVAAALAQATILPALGPLAVLPNPTLVLLLVWSALRGVGEGLLWVFVAGLLLDVLAMDSLGANGLALLVVAILAGPARRRFFHSGMVFPLLLALLATIVHALVLVTLRAAADGGSMLPVGAVAKSIVLQALLNALLVPPLYLVAAWVDRWAPES